MVSRRSRLAFTRVSTGVVRPRGTASSCDFAGISWPNVAFSRSWASRRRPSASAASASGLLRGQHALGDEPRAVELAHGRVVRDLLDHQRLGVRRLVLLVVAEAAVADEVDHDVVAEPAAVGEREADAEIAASGSSALTWTIGVSKPFARSDEWRVERPCAGIGREADLVVRDQVQRAAGRVALERVEVQRLGDDPLARERGVAVQEDRHRDRRVVRAVA